MDIIDKASMCSSEFSMDNWSKQTLLELKNCREMLSQGLNQYEINEGEVRPTTLRTIHCLLKVMQMEYQLIMKQELQAQESRPVSQLQEEDIAILERYKKEG